MPVRAFSPRLFSDRRIVLLIFASIFVGFFFFFRDNVQDAYDAIPIDRKTGSSGFAIPPKRPDDPDVVELDYIAVRPKKAEFSKSFWNIPYAASTYGKNRFRGPQPLGRKFDGVVEYNGKVAKCPNIQKIDHTLRNREDISPEHVLGLETEHTEDCLSLHVFTPIDAVKPKP